MNSQQKQNQHQNSLQIPKALESWQKIECEEKDTIVIRLKDLHMETQKKLVKGIVDLAQQSGKLIDDITIIQKDIEQYQNHLDIWLKRTEEHAQIISKIKSTSNFKQKAINITKLKQFLQPQKSKRR